MIVAVCGVKGGSGKSTCATNIAVMLGLSGRDTLLIDADDQSTSLDFTNLRNEALGKGAGYTCVSLTGRAVFTEGRRLAEKHEETVIDCGGRDTAAQRAALAIAHIAVIPTSPRSFDLWVIERIAALVEEVRQVNPNLRAVAFLNKADPAGSDNDAAAEMLKATPGIEFIDAPLGQRKAFANAASQGLGVVELRPADAKASSEMGILFEHLFDIQKISSLRSA